ncbi:unnamed protein product [Clonostachys solani]|uniref:Uncharacterized protein n=1 Tax=Clonostachys solani TaxID=160281 RepID=A0A9N9YYX8_9HYPO|nr:unnamed protein product [Clonostachys solani]
MASLDSLPNEILGNCGSHCDILSLASLARTNRHFNEVYTPILYRRSLFIDPPTRPVIFQAAASGNLATMELAVAHGADINAVSTETFQECNEIGVETQIEQDATALHVACYNGQTNIVSFLLKAEVDVHFPDGATFTPFYYAMRLQNPERKAITDLLIQSGIQYVSSNPHKWTLHAALEASCWPVVETILSNRHFENPFFTGPYGQETNNMAEAVFENGYNPLHFISKSSDATGISEVVPKLVAAGTPLEHVTDDWDQPMAPNGGTPLIYAVKQQNWAAATALVENGAELDSIGNSLRQEIALHIALDNRLREPEIGMRSIEEIKRDPKLHQEFIRAFIEKAKESNKMELIERRPERERGWKGTPLWYAATRASNYDCMKLLLEEGSASPHATVEKFVPANANGVEDGQNYRWVEMTILRSLLSPFAHSKTPILADGAKLLLEHGARLDAEVDQANTLFSTVLDRACEYCEGKRTCWLFGIILESATNNNVSLQYVAELEKKYVGDRFVIKFLDKLRERLN